MAGKLPSALQGALIIVSHDRYFLDKVATLTLDLTKHSLDRYVAIILSLSSSKEKSQTELQNYEKQQKEIAKLEDFVQKNIVRASTTKRAQARRKQLEKMERLDKPTTGQKSANMTFQSDKTSGNIVLTVENAAVGYDGNILSQPISIDQRKLDAIAIVGPNGIGKQPCSNPSSELCHLSKGNQARSQRGSRLLRPDPVSPDTIQHSLGGALVSLSDHT